MKLEDMGIEELVKVFGDSCYERTASRGQYETELLRRFSALAAERDALRKELREWKDSRDGVISENEAFALEALNLQCCGNCLNMQANFDGLLCTEDNKYKDPYNVCDDWKSDGKAKEQRC